MDNTNNPAKALSEDLGTLSKNRPGLVIGMGYDGIMVDHPSWMSASEKQTINSEVQDAVDRYGLNHLPVHLIAEYRKSSEYSRDDLGIDVGVAYADNGDPVFVYKKDNEGRAEIIGGRDQSQRDNVIQKLSNLDPEFDPIYNQPRGNFPQVTLELLNTRLPLVANAEAELANSENLTKRKITDLKQSIRFYKHHIKDWTSELNQIGGKYRQKPDPNDLITVGKTAPPMPDKKGTRNLTPDKKVKMIQGFRSISGDPEDDISVGWARVDPDKDWYHGTQSEFEQFNPEKNLAKRMGIGFGGISFAGSVDLAEGYALTGSSSGEGELRYEDHVPSVKMEQVIHAQVDLSDTQGIIPIYRVPEASLEEEFEILAELEEHTRAAGYPAFMRVLDDGKPFPELIVISPNKISITKHQPYGNSLPVPNLDIVSNAVDEYKHADAYQDAGLDKSIEYQGIPQKPAYRARGGRGKIGY